MALHLLLTLLFSIVHIAGMFVIRQLWHGLINTHYHFGDLSIEFLYEYRKDTQAYLITTLIVFGHSSTIVNMAQIKEIQAQETGDYHVILQAGKILVLSRRYREAFKTKLNLNA